jgi:hypothetical protein
VAVALVLDEAGEVLTMWRRFVDDSWGWEPPGGIITRAKTARQPQPVRCGKRTGWQPESLVLSSQPTVSMVDMPHEIYAGRGAELVGEPTDLEEAARSEWVPRADVFGLIGRG